VDQPVLGPSVNGSATTSNLLDTTYLAPANTFNKFTALRQLPRPAVAVGDLGALLAGPRRRATQTARPDRAQTPTASTTTRCRTRPDFNGEKINQSFHARMDGGAGAELQHARLLLQDEAESQTRISSSSATRRRNRSPPGSGCAATSS
jgi:hypothetical protein